MFLIDKVNSYERKVDSFIDKLILLNPLTIMKKGYTLTYQNDKLLSSISQINVNQDLVIRFHDGSIKAKIIKEKDGKYGKI